MQPLETVRVLLLEDDPEDKNLLIKSIRNQKCHFAVEWTKTLEEATTKLKQATYDVVLTDLSVPDSHGLDTVIRIKQHSGKTPVIVLTGSDDENVEKNILVVGAQDYLVKGELGGSAVTRVILHAVQRQQYYGEMNALVRELMESQQLLEQKKQLLYRKNRRLRRLYKSAQEFVDNVSHDFRTPLTVIKDYVTIIREGMVGSINDEQQAMLDKVSVRADDLNNMVDDLLDVSKLESGLLGAWRRNVEVKEIIERTQCLLKQRAAVRNVELDIEIAPNLPEVYCDADKVGRVITNLVVNAIKFAGDPGRVKLTAEVDLAGHQVVVSTTDNGAGIDEEKLKQIFQRFRQLDSQVNKATKGFGLGLSIAQQLCRLNLGELSVQSREGKGSTFSFTIPLADPVEVLSRWLELQKRNDGILRTVEISLASDAEISSAEEFDSFLNCLLRSKDLLLQIDSHRWLLVMAVAPSEASRWFTRARKEFERTNRNRPLGPLPSYDARVLGEWEMHESAEKIIQQFSSFVHQLETVET